MWKYKPSPQCFSKALVEKGLSASMIKDIFFLNKKAGPETEEARFLMFNLHRAVSLKNYSSSLKLGQRSSGKGGIYQEVSQTCDIGCFVSSSMGKKPAHPVGNCDTLREGDRLGAQPAVWIVVTRQSGES